MDSNRNIKQCWGVRWQLEAVVQALVGSQQMILAANLSSLWAN